MAVGATFQDSPGTDFLGQQFSLMQRAQSMRIQQQQADQQKAEFQAKLPLIQASATANIASAQASVANATRMEQLRTKAAAESKSYNDEFLDAIQLADFNAQSSALAGLQAKVAYMSIIPEYKGFVDTVNKARLDAHGSALLDQRLEEQSQTAVETARARQDAADAAAQSRVDVATIQAGARTQNASTYASSREKIAAINADTKLSVEDKRAKKQGIQMEDLQQHAIDADQAAADAAAAGDERSAALHRQVAASYRDAVQKTTTFAGSTPSVPRDASQDPRPSPKPSQPAPPPLNLSGLTAEGRASGQQPQQSSPAVAPTKVPKNATSVSIGGKDYPVFVDKNGNRAYKIDGHYVPIQSE